jgi:hypothetical protein
MPISRVPRPDGTWGAILHSVNHGKPGMISVLRNGKRFADESLSYHDLVAKMVAAPEAGKPAGAFIICDHNAFSRFGLGYAKPFLPLKNLIEAGYLIKADTIRDLATNAGMDPDVLEATINNYNVHAENGEDPEFGKGKNAYGKYLGDDSYGPNPNIAPLTKPPFRGRYRGGDRASPGAGRGASTRERQRNWPARPRASDRPASGGLSG